MSLAVSCPGCQQPTAVDGPYGRRVLAVHQRRDGRRLCKFSGTRVRRRQVQRQGVLG